MRCDINLAVVVIIATSVLHNWTRERPVPPVEAGLVIYPEVDQAHVFGSGNNITRNNIINTFFHNEYIYLITKTEYN